MNIKELRELKKDELVKKLEKKQAEVAELKFDVKVGSEKDYANISKLKKEIARIHTILKEESFAGEEKESSAAKTKKVK